MALRVDLASQASAAVAAGQGEVVDEDRSEISSARAISARAPEENDP